MRRVVLTFGLIAGAVLSLSMAISMYFSEQIGFERGAIVGYTSMVAAFMMIYFGVRSYRDSTTHGAIGFWPAARVGLLITLVASVCYVATWEVVYTRFMPDFMQKYASYALEKAKSGGASPESIETQRQELATLTEQYKRPLYRMGFTMLEPLPVGLLITLVSAAVLSRKKRAAMSSLVADVS